MHGHSKLSYSSVGLCQQLFFLCFLKCLRHIYSKNIRNQVISYIGGSGFKMPSESFVAASSKRRFNRPENGRPLSFST